MIIEKKTKIWLIGSLVTIIALIGILSITTQQKIEPTPPPSKVEPTTEINCTEKVEYFLLRVPGSFESVEKGVEWCNECVNNNGIPTLSFDIGPFCNLKTSDAGKICIDSSQCEGVCLAESDNSKSGKCSDTESVLGCVFEMTNGKSLEICFD